MRRLLTACMLLALTIPAAAETIFGGLDLSDQDILLFQAEVDAPGLGTYTSLFSADLSAVSASFSDAAVAGGDILQQAPVTPLSFYPELVSYLPQLEAVQIQNRFGLFRGSVESREFRPVSGFEGFTDGASIATGRLIPVTASPDGRYLTILEPTSAAYGQLVLVATATGERHVVSAQVELSTETEPARWSPDSRFFVYSRGKRVFYFSLPQYERGRVLTESFRELGPGTIASVRWSTRSSLFYLNGSLVYEIEGAEFFTRSLYAGLLQIGTIRGKLPFPFDAGFDAFWIAPDGRNILLNKGGRNLFVLYLDEDDFVDDGQILTLPALFLPRNTRVRQVIWTELGELVVLAGGIEQGRTDSALFRMSLLAGVGELDFERTDDSMVAELALSPDERTVALLESGGVRFRNSATWREEAFVATPDPLHAVWVEAGQLLVAGRSRIEIVTPAGDRRLLTFAQTDDHSVLDDGTIVVQSDGEYFEYQRSATGSRWVPSRFSVESRREVAGSRFRVFLESLNSGSYRNIVMVRRARGVGTSRLFPPPQTQYEMFPQVTEPVDFSFFTHGSRIRRREVSLVFNAVDSVAGLTEILLTLDAYDLRATFFLNGEFIRRHPAAVREIAASGHEVGSLFFAYFDMSDRRFQLTEEFIREGLSRNEDEYYAATGDELSLLWHAPYYFTSDEVISWGEQANYVYVGRDVDSLDWVPLFGQDGVSSLYEPSADLVERVLELKQPGSIVSVQVGTLDDARGGRDDYLFQRLDILINGLLSQGYQLVPVSTLIENAR